MTIDKAIETLTDYAERLPLGVNDDYINALKLGIEALEYVAFWNEKQLPQHQIHLPGETEE